MKLIMRTEPQVYARIAAYFRLNTPRNHSLVLCSSCQTLQIEKGRTALKKFVSGGKLHEQPVLLLRRSKTTKGAI